MTAVTELMLRVQPRGQTYNIHLSERMEGGLSVREPKFYPNTGDPWLVLGWTTVGIHWLSYPG